MGTTTQPTTFSDLYTALQNALREQTGVTATQTVCKRAINTALQDMHVGYAEHFQWAERRAILVTHPQYTTGTVTATQGSTTLTGSGTAWNTTGSFGVTNVIAGGKLRINGGSEIYEVSSVGSDTALTLTSRFTQDTVSGAAYVSFEDEYALASDFLRPIDVRQFADGMDIELIGRTEFRRRYPRNYLTGRPEVATLMDLPPSANTTPVRKVAFYKAPDRAYSVPYSYVTSNLALSSLGVAQTSLSADADEPIVPLRYRHAIVLHALYNLYRDSKDDDRSIQVKGEYDSLLARMVSDTEIGQSRPQLRPRTSAYVSRARRPYRR